MTESNWRRILKVILWTASFSLVIYLGYLLSDVVIIVIVSILLAFIFDPLVSKLEREGVNRLASAVLIFGGFGFLVYLFLSSVIPSFILQMNELVETLRVYSLHEQLLKVEKEIYSYLPFFSLGQLSKKIEEFISSQIVNSFDSLSLLLTSILSVAAILVIIPFITFFLLKDSRSILQGILLMMPNKYFEVSYWIIKKVSIQIGGFVRAWIFDATFVGICCGLGFYFIGIPNALPLGVIAGTGHLVPYLGPIIGGIPAIIISIIHFGNLSALPLIILLLAVVYTIDNGFFQPYVFSKSTNMHPIIIILLIITGSQLFGILGMLLAVPTAAVIRTLAKEFYYGFKNYRIARL